MTDYKYIEIPRMNMKSFSFAEFVKRIKELEEENAQLKERNDSLNNRDINLCRIANGIRDENFALKELLKECKRYIDIWGYTDTHENLLLPQINQALGEEE